VSDEPRRALDALRAHLDLDGPPEEILRAWGAASEEEKKELLDDLLLGTLLTEHYGGGLVELRRGSRRRACERDGPAGRRGFQPRRHAAGSRVYLVAAALLVAAGVAIYLWGSRASYPTPTAKGDFGVLSATDGPGSRRAVMRGDRLTAGPGGGELSLGGYCEVALSPGTIVVVRGEPRKEVVALEEGKVRCRVVPARGAFRVLTPRGSLDVVGTEFETAVEYPVPKGERAVSSLKRSAMVTVIVVTGLVAYQFGDLTGVLSAGTSQAFGAEGAGKKIVAGKPTYLPKDGHEAWKDKGRIVGLVRQCPGCKVEALDAEGKEVVKSSSVEAKGRVYELQWLSPGTYRLRVSADGYETLIVPGLVVKTDNDLSMNIEFEGAAER
jgi:ferric-dicitrate binding protein FerR (iron transport regulator)